MEWKEGEADMKEKKLKPKTKRENNKKMREIMAAWGE